MVFFCLLKFGSFLLSIASRTTNTWVWDGQITTKISRISKIISQIMFMCFSGNTNKQDNSWHKQKESDNCETEQNMEEFHLLHPSSWFIWKHCYSWDFEILLMGWDLSFAQRHLSHLLKDGSVSYQQTFKHWIMCWEKLQMD